MTRAPSAGRRGSYIAKAAVVLPFVILSVITVVLIIMFFYESSLAESRMHMALRCEAGLITEKYTTYSEDATVLPSDAVWNGSITTSGVSPAKHVFGNGEVHMVSRGLLSGIGMREITGDLRAADPVKLLRIRQAVHSPEESGDD